MTKKQLIYDNTFCGEAVETDTSDNQFKELAKLSFGNSPKFMTSIIGMAVSQSVELSLQELAKYVRLGEK